MRTLSFAFNNSGDLASASDPAATYSYSYDGLGRVTDESQTIYGLTPALNYVNVYDVVNRGTQLQAVIGGTNDFQNTYTYDNLSRLTRLAQQDVSGGNVVADKRVDFAYDAGGALAAIDRYADQSAAEHVVSTHYSYDGMGRLTKLLHNDVSLPLPLGEGWGEGILAGYQYAYDAASRFASIDSYVDGLTEYDHDATDQLTGADHTGQTDEAYTYDANGNRTMSGYSTTDNNQLTTDGVYNYTYDDEGNRLTKTKISNGKKVEYTWDHRNRLTKITFKNSDETVTKTVYQRYDVFNRWVYRCVEPNASTENDTFFSYEDGQIVLQFDDGGAASDLAHRYTWAAGVDKIMADEQVTSLSSAGTMLWPLGDHLGTLRDLATYNTSTDDTAIANHRRYDSYGNLTSETNAAVDLIFGYTGRPFDESTGQQNNVNRWYDSVTGQWMSEDPIGFGAGDANIRRYVGNLPIKRNDPTGLAWPWPGPGNFDPDAPTPYVPPPYDANRCAKLEQTIKDIEKDIAKRVGELDENPLNLPWRCPGDEAKPSLSRWGHLRLINQLKLYKARAIAEYEWKCRQNPRRPVPRPVPIPIEKPVDQPHMPPIFLPIPIPSPRPRPIPVPRGGGGGGGGGCMPGSHMPFWL